MEVFRHIAYAKAGRFSEPVQAPLSEGEGGRVPTACPQRPFRLGFLMGEPEQYRLSEDCQFLNIWTPSKSGNYPVLVWIPGGAYVAGTGEAASYDGSALCQQGDVVVVTLSYRLGIWGYLYHAEKDIVNLGLKDQIMALRWIKENIAHFGGDPERITLAGQSAGGHSVAAIIAACKEPLFHRAIIQSAPLGFRCSPKQGEKLYRQAVRAAGKPLTECSTEELLAVQRSVLSQSGSMMAYSPIAPDFSGTVSVPTLRKVLVTWQKDDASPFVAIKLRHKERFGSSLDRTATRLASELVFAAPARKYARALQSAGLEVTQRCLDWRPEGSPFGACHCLEMSLLLGSWERWKGAGMLGSVSQEEWEARGSRLRGDWLNFVGGR